MTFENADNKDVKKDTNQSSRNNNFDENQFLRQSTVHQSQLVDIEDKEKEIFATISDRINDYREATQYFMSVVGDKKRAMEFLEIGEKFKKVQVSISQGKKIDLLKLDPPVTPNLILGYNEEERQKSKLFTYVLPFRIQ